MAERARPPRPSVINSARTRLGHFQRLSGDPALALATLHLAVAEAVRVYGPHHPDTAVAHFALGPALADDKPDEAIAELRQSLEIRRAAFPGGSLPVAESLLGLGDALSTKGHDAEAIVALDDALAILDKIHESESPQAVNAHVMIGMALEQVKRAEQALPHYLRAADITERSEQHREAVTAMALRLAASVEANHDHAGLGVLQLERALRLLERGKASPADLGKTQYDLSELLLAIKPPDLPRARAMAETARASLTAAGPAGAEDLALTEKFMHAHHWQ